MEKPRISVIIPCLDEEGVIAATLSSCPPDSQIEVIVADGGSNDSSIEIARASGARVIQAAAGRASQMNAGAEASTGDILLFLHADTRLPANFKSAVGKCLSAPGTVAGAFRLRIEGRGLIFRLIEAMANMRSKILGIPYGDQALFMGRQTFFGQGGFPGLPIMEDLEMMRRLRHRGAIRICPEAILTSGRRWHTLGPIRTTLLNQFLVAAYLLGVSPERLSAIYRRSSRRQLMETGKPRIVIYKK